MRVIIVFALAFSMLGAGDGLSALEVGPDVCSVKIASEGSKLLGRHFTPRLPHAEAKAPAVLMLHGIPGTEQNWDVAYALRDAGFHCLLFHYRGCWGSEGNYSIRGLPDDISAAFQWLASQPQVDKEKVVVVGHSLGGYQALRMALHSARQGRVPPPFEKLPGSPPTLRGAVALCPLVGCDSIGERLPDPYAQDFARFLTAIAPAEILEELAELKAIKDLAESVPEPVDPRDKLPLLVISGDDDELFGPEYYSAHLWPALDKCPGVAARGVRMRYGDHALSRYRREVVRRVVAFCRRSVGGAATARVPLRERALRVVGWAEEMARDFVPLMVMGAAAAGFAAGRYDATPEGVARARAEELRERERETTVLDRQ